MWLFLVWLLLAAPEYRLQVPAPKPLSWSSLAPGLTGVTALRVAGERAAVIKDGRLLILALPALAEERGWPLEGRMLEAFDGLHVALSHGPRVELWDARTGKLLHARTFSEPRVGLSRGRLLVVTRGLWLHILDPRGSERRVQLESPSFRRKFGDLPSYVQLVCLSADHLGVLYNLVYDGGSKLVSLDLTTQKALTLSDQGPGDHTDYRLSQDGAYLASETLIHPGDGGSGVQPIDGTLELGQSLVGCPMAWFRGLADAGGGRVAFRQEPADGAATLELLDLRHGQLVRCTGVPRLAALGVSDRGDCVVLDEQGHLCVIPR